MITFICPWFGESIPERYRQCVAVTQATVESAGHVFELRQLPAVGGPHAAAIAKDRLVLDLARSMPEAAFIDADIELFKVPEIRPGAPGFIFEWNTPRIGFFLVNENTQFFVDLQREKTRRGIEDVFGYPNKLLRDKAVAKISGECYRHNRFTSGITF